MLPLDPASGPTGPSAGGGTFVRPGAVAWGEAPGKAQAAPPPEIVEKALAAVAGDPEGTSALLDELSRARVWVPLATGDHPVTDGSAVELPTVRYLGAEFVPCFTSARRLAAWEATHAYLRMPSQYHGPCALDGQGAPPAGR